MFINLYLLVGLLIFTAAFFIFMSIRGQHKNSADNLKLHLAKFQQSLLEKNQQHAQEKHDREIQHLTTMQKLLQSTISDYAKDVNENFNKISNRTDDKLQKISNKVDEQLQSGFKQTNQTITDIIKRLAIIDTAQQKITDLSENVVSLQKLLADKRSRGAFGEVQLKNLIENMIPAKNVSFQHTLSNDTRCDCILFLPSPTGNIVIDAKFPLESYHTYTNPDSSTEVQQQALKQFRQDIKKHIQDISSKYILPGETADGAIMFIPAESIFSEIHSQIPEVVDFAHENKVWLASPTTMMAILTTAGSVLKDSATKEHIHLIKDHLKALAKDFSRFDLRLQKLTKHISLANDNAQQINISSNKISSRFAKIEKAELEGSPEELISDLEETDVKS